MNELISIWNIIVNSNTFNFLVMLAILWWVITKIDISSSLEKAKNDIIDKINASKTKKENSIKILNEAMESVKNLSEEIDNQLKDAEQKAENLKNNIISNANYSAEQFNQNVSKIINSEEQQTNSRLITKAVYESKNLAIQKIISLLKEKPELHEKIINESIEQLDGINL